MGLAVSPEGDSRTASRLQTAYGVMFALQVLSVIAAVALLAMALVYLLFPSYMDHAEATVASLSWMLFAGDQPLYHGAEAAARYAISYGPTLYLLVGLPALTPIDAIAASKIAGILACVLAFFTLLRLLRGMCEPPVALLLIGLFAWYLLLFGNAAYWNRPEPFLLLCVAAGLSLASTASLRAAVIAVGVITGIALNLKLHGGVYMLPALTLLLQRRPGIADLTMALAAALAVFAAPFLLPQVPLLDYLRSMTVAPRHGLSVSQLIESLAYLALLLAPVLAFALLRPLRAPPSNLRVLVGACTAALIVITVISAKRGAGPHHLLPLLPSVLYLCALLAGRDRFEDSLQRIAAGRRAFAGFLLLAAAYTTTVWLAIHSQAGIAALLAQAGTDRDASRELRELLARYSGSALQMGYSDRHQYRIAYLRPLVVAHGHPYWLDAAALMDYDAAGIALPTATLDRLAACDTPLWILPAGGAPFSMTNFYATGRNIFGDAFGRMFAERYQRIASTHYFAVWGCRSDPD